MLQALFYQATSRLHLPTLRLPGANLAAVETLRIPAFRYLWGSYGLAALANQMRVMVIAWLVLELTGSQLWVGLANGLPTIALAGFSLASGVLVDRTSPRRVLFWVRLTMVVATLLTGVLVGAGMVQLWHIILLTSLTGGVYGMDLVASRICVNAVGKERP